MKSNLKISGVIFTVFLLTHAFFAGAKSDSDVWLNKATIDAAVKKHSSQKFSPADESPSPQGKTTTSFATSSKEGKNAEEWRQIGQSYLAKAQAAKNNADKAQYFGDAASAWEKIKGDPQMSRLTAETYVDAASFAEKGYRRRLYFLKAAWIYNALGEQSKFEDLLKFAERE